ncbi:hypothetical protein EXIGLDRAFT_396146 [Exidia glandulosa HHB12029]|nr:hypothetical protein EXIGLDRAFT_396146 [Exidia glandulosa HHB12029]
MASILPVFFGISQTLITFRLGVTKELSQQTASTSASGTRSSNVQWAHSNSDTTSGTAVLHIHSPRKTTHDHDGSDFELGDLQRRSSVEKMHVA